MRFCLLCCCAAALLACAKSDDAATDTAAMATAAPPPPPIQLADVAGTWDMKGMPANSDSVLLTYQVQATADTTGWTLMLPNRRPIPMRVVSVGGDSIVIAAGPYQSVLQKGVQVSTKGFIRLRDGKITGATVATYKTKAGDSLVTIRHEGVRKP